MAKVERLFRLSCRWWNVSESPSKYIHYIHKYDPTTWFYMLRTISQQTISFIRGDRITKFFLPLFSSNYLCTETIHCSFWTITSCGQAFGQRATGTLEIVDRDSNLALCNMWTASKPAWVFSQIVLSRCRNVYFTGLKYDKDTFCLLGINLERIYSVTMVRGDGG